MPTHVHVDQRSGPHRAHQRHRRRATPRIAARWPTREIGRIEDALQARSLARSHQHHRRLGSWLLDAQRASQARRTGRTVRQAVARRLAGHRRQPKGAINFRPAQMPARRARDRRDAAAAAAGRRDLHQAEHGRRQRRRRGGHAVVRRGALESSARRRRSCVGELERREERGQAMPGRRPTTGVAGHGSSSPYDVHNTLIAAGPDLREHAVSDVPTGNADLAPTLLTADGPARPAVDDRPRRSRRCCATVRRSRP